MTTCVICQDRDAEERSQACARDAGRLAGALRQIPVLVDELHGLGYVERDTGERRAADGGPGGRGWDPVANVFPSGPVPGASTGPRAGGTRERSLPIRVDPTDLLARPRYGSLLVAARSPWPDDQIGHLPVAATLDFWVRDWADTRGEGLPDIGTRTVRPVALLCGWLEVRLDWALRDHLALDEFARDVSDLLGALWGLAGHGAARPKLMEVACPACELPTLVQPFPEANIECGDPTCGRVLTPLEYEEMVMELRHEITAVDVLTVLNGLEPVKLDGLRFVVITTGYTETPQHRRGELSMVEHEERWWPFERGEVVVVNSSGREVFGEQRKPSKWSVGREEFGRLADAVARREQLLAGEAS